MCIITQASKNVKHIIVVIELEIMLQYDTLYNAYRGFIVCLKHRKMSTTISSKIATTAITVMAAVTPALKPLSCVSIIREVYVITIGIYEMCVYLHLLHKSYNIHHC